MFGKKEEKFNYTLELLYKAVKTTWLSVTPHSSAYSHRKPRSMAGRY